MKYVLLVCVILILIKFSFEVGRFYGRADAVCEYVLRKLDRQCYSSVDGFK